MDIPLALINIHITIKTCSEGISRISTATEVYGIIYVSYSWQRTDCGDEGTDKNEEDSLIYGFMPLFRPKKQEVTSMR